MDDVVEGYKVTPFKTVTVSETVTMTMSLFANLGNQKGAREAKANKDGRSAILEYLILDVDVELFQKSVVVVLEIVCLNE